jgi:V8-like Glu-specific endopeptidase
MRFRVSTVTVLMSVVALLVAFGPVGTGVAAGSGSRAGEPSGTPTARHFRGTRTVGALFPPDSSVHTCTASVVESTAGNVLVTAAHCISGTGDGYTFAPDYHDGIEPFGSWIVVGAYGAPQWIDHRTPQLDFAFLVVAPRQLNGHVEQIQDVTGSNSLATAPVAGEQVTVPAYATGRDDEPITCTTRVYYRGTFPAFNCNPYPDGTSGAPWLHRTSHGWTVVGVVGGLHQGGCYTWTSYSAAFGPVTLRTETGAAAGTNASTFPSPGRDGCSAEP